MTISGLCSGYLVKEADFSIIKIILYYNNIYKQYASRTTRRLAQFPVIYERSPPCLYDSWSIQVARVESCDASRSVQSAVFTLLRDMRSLSVLSRQGGA